MTNEITTQQQSGMTVYDPQLIKTLRNSLYPGATDESLMMVMEYCKHAKLDIMLKPVHIVPMYVKDKKTDRGEMRDVIMPGINLYRIIASRSGCAGISEPEFGEEVTASLSGTDIIYPKWCKVTVRRLIAGQIVEFTAKEYWLENYATAAKDSKAPNAMWRKRPYGQLAKCAEAQALRKAFPEIGAMPTAEEMEGRSIDSDELDAIQKKVPGKGVDGLKDKLGITYQDTATDADFADVAEIDDITGEILAPKEPEPNTVAVETVKFLIETAPNVKALIHAVEQARTLPEVERKLLRECYNKRAKELAAKTETKVE